MGSKDIWGESVDPVAPPYGAEDNPLVKLILKVGRKKGEAKDTPKQTRSWIQFIMVVLPRVWPLQLGVWWSGFNSLAHKHYIHVGMKM